MYSIPPKAPVAKQYRSKLPEMPDPQWYLEQFRSHIGKIHELFKVCPPQQWKALSLSIGNALSEVAKKTEVKAGHCIQMRPRAGRKNDLEEVEGKLLGCI